MTTPFTDALKKGHGRAMALLRTDPGSPTLQAELLAACKVNITFDPQCEHSRAPYLARLIQQTGQAQAIWTDLHQELARHRAADQRDTVQMFETLCQLAVEDPALDRTLLTTILQRADFDDIGRDIMEPYVALQGIEGLTLCVHNFAHVIGRKDWNEDDCFSRLKDTLATRDGPAAAAEHLRTARAHDPELHRLLALVETETPGVPDPPRPDRAAVADLVARKRRVPRSWTRNIPPEDLEWAAHQALAAVDSTQARSYLRVFTRQRYPLPPTTLIPFVHAGDALLVDVAVRVLSRIAAPEIRTLALHLASSGTNPAPGIELLSSNLHPGDFARIEQALHQALTDEETYHDIGFATFDIVEHLPSPLEETRTALLHLYEHEPCANCRQTAVQNLVTLGGLPTRIVEECQFDSLADTATLARTAVPPRPD